MYLEHFELSKLPFALTPNTAFYCDLPEYQAALNIILFGVKSGEGFIKIVGEVGSGKTLLCRRLLNNLTEPFVTAYIPNPDLTPSGLRKTLARELGVELTKEDDSAEVLDKLQKKLIELNKQNKRPVLLIDEAQVLSNESLEALRLLSNLETESEKLLHIILFGQPELDERLNEPSLRQLKQRITFSYFLKGLRRSELDEYIHHRLIKAGYTHRDLFAKPALDLVYQYSKGTPRVINTLCHKALLSAYGKGKHKICKKDVMAAIEDDAVDTKMILKGNSINPIVFIVSTFIIVVLLVIIASEATGWIRW